MKSKQKSVDKITKVIFRKYPNGDVIALFPDIHWNSVGDITSYMHVGQHGGANYRCVMKSTRPVDKGDFESLHKELKAVGYDNLQIIKRK